MQKNAAATPEGVSIDEPAAFGMAAPEPAANERLRSLHTHRRWTPVVRPADTPPSGSAARLWRPLAGPDRHLATSRSTLLPRSSCSPPREMCVKPLSARSTILAQHSRHQERVAPTDEDSGTVDVGTRCDGTSRGEQPTLESSLRIGQPLEFKWHRLSQVITKTSKPTSPTNPGDMRQREMRGGRQAERDRVLPALTPVLANDTPHAVVRLWL